MAVLPAFTSAPPASQPSVHEIVLHYLRKLLVTGDLPPGAKIPVDAVAQACGVSPVPVREALRQLQNEGIVVNEPRRGYWVARHSRSEFNELQHITLLLEREAVHLGADNIAAADVERMDAFRVEMEEALVAGDLWTANVAHREMHFVPYRASGRKRLVREIERLWEHTDHYRVLYLYKDEHVQEVALAQHLGLIDACRSQNAGEIVSLLSEHRDFAAATITPGLLDDDGVSERDRDTPE